VVFLTSNGAHHAGHLPTDVLVNERKVPYTCRLLSSITNGKSKEESVGERLGLGAKLFQVVLCAGKCSLMLKDQCAVLKDILRERLCKRRFQMLEDRFCQAAGIISFDLASLQSRSLQHCFQVFKVSGHKWVTRMPGDRHEPSYV
jgi:hypothetical protein